jgi:hypothetical protein
VTLPATQTAGTLTRDQGPGTASDATVDLERGITQFIVETVGKNLKSFWGEQANSRVRNGLSCGVLKLELLERSYTWSFISEHGEVLGSGTGQLSSEELVG